MNRTITWFKNIRLGKVITAFLSGILLFVTTACGSSGVMATPVDQVRTADKVREEVPSRALTSPYQGGMNDYSDTDPRFSEKGIQTKTKGLVDNAERNVIDQTDDVGTNTKRILDKKGENARDFGRNVKDNTDALGDKTQRSASDFAKGTKKGTENIKANTQDAADDAAEGVKGAKQAGKDLSYKTQRATDNIQQNTQDAGRGLAGRVQEAANKASSYVQDKLD